uniref:Rhodopsin domain-containing protein n=1 Tax=Photinus pyralis TaxID=7054 RepID=A0A1Y1KZ45_PHOPY
MATDASTSSHSTTAGILAEYYILFFIALALIVLRIYVRLRVAKNWGWDDYYIIVAWIFLLIGLVLVQIEADLGLGRHLHTLEDPEDKELGILKFNTFFQMANVLCTLFTKYSISIFILRIRDSKRLRWVLGFLMALMTLATIAVIVVLSVSCIPLRRLWDKTVPGTCLPLVTVYNVAYVQSGFTIVIDLCLTTAPILILWNVKVKRGRKTFICLLMSLGLIATVSNALRNYFQNGLTTSDMTYDMTGVTVLAILELCSGIIAANIPACMPLFTRRPKTARTTTCLPNGGGDYMMHTKSAAADTPSSSIRNNASLDAEDNVSLRRLTQPSKVATDGAHAV